MHRTFPRATGLDAFTEMIIIRSFSMSRRMLSWFTAAAAGLVLLAGGAGTSRADIAVTLESQSQITSGPLAGNYLYTYGVVATGNNQVRSGDFFTIYDFGDYISDTAKASLTTAGFTVSSAPVGVTPPGVTLTENPDVANLTFTYLGPTLNGLYNLGRFTAVSTNGVTVAGLTSSQTSDFVSGARQVGSGSTLVPLAAPEPSTLIMAALAAPFAWKHFKRRRRAITS